LHLFNLFILNTLKQQTDIISYSVRSASFAQATSTETDSKRQTASFNRKTNKKTQYAQYSHLYRAPKTSNLSAQPFWRSKQGVNPLRASESSKHGDTGQSKAEAVPPDHPSMEF